MEKLHDLEGIFELLNIRKSSVFTNYKPTHKLHENYYSSGTHEYIDSIEVKPGEKADVKVWLLSPKAYPNCIWVNRIIDICEGEKIIGKLKVTKILNPILVVDPKNYKPIWVKPDIIELDL